MYSLIFANIVSLVTASVKNFVWKQKLKIDFTTKELNYERVQRRLTCKGDRG